MVLLFNTLPWLLFTFLIKSQCLLRSQGPSYLASAHLSLGCGVPQAHWLSSCSVKVRNPFSPQTFVLAVPCARNTLPNLLTLSSSSSSRSQVKSHISREICSDSSIQRTPLIPQKIKSRTTLITDSASTSV